METYDDWTGWDDDAIAERWIVETRERKPSSGVTALLELTSQDPERCWRIVLAVLEKVDDDGAWLLANVGAGPLEDLLNQHGPVFIDRFVLQARRDRRFRAAAASIWPSSDVDAALWKRLSVLLGPA
ncbi:hypothetical protein KPL74_11610 [Bacillus sp. NP157]|nr:hypothetical protein KPL74_11610 [Bacillus sp. NP157]